MAIPIIYEDAVDWEPLVMRFVPAKRLTSTKAKRIAQYIQDWMDDAAESSPDLWRWAKEWQCTATNENEVIAHCEFIPPEELPRLADDLHTAFPLLQEIRLGYPLDGPATTAEFDWFVVHAGDIKVGRKTHSLSAFAVSFTPVTLGQFEEFLRSTGYEPVPDCLIGTFKINYGPSPKHPLFGVTHDDATAFCEWAKLRLPSDPELKHFFHVACRNKKPFKYSGECWTSTTTAEDKFVAWNGPYHEDWLGEPDRKYRKLLHRHQDDSPCFRVVRPVST